MGDQDPIKNQYWFLIVISFGNIQYIKLWTCVWHWPILEYKLFNYFLLSEFVHKHKYAWWGIKISFKWHINYIILIIWVTHSLYQMAIRKFDIFLKSPHPTEEGCPGGRMWAFWSSREVKGSDVSFTLSVFLGTSYPRTGSWDHKLWL